MIDWQDREIVGYDFVLRGSVQEVERVLIAPWLTRFGRGPTSELLIFQRRRLRRDCRDITCPKSLLLHAHHDETD